MEIKEQPIAVRFLCVMFAIGLIYWGVSGSNIFSDTTESVATVINSTADRWEYVNTSNDDQVYYSTITVELPSGEITKYTHTSYNGYYHPDAGGQIKVTINSDGTVAQYQSPENAFGSGIFLILLGVCVLYVETIGYYKAQKEQLISKYIVEQLR